MPTRDWRFLVWPTTATSLSTAGVDFTVTNAQLSQIPVITGSRLRVLDGRTEARPWTVNVLDTSSYFTSQIGGSGGRLDLLNRFVQARLSIDGSTYQPVAGGRLVDAVNTDNIQEWLVTVQDEWLAGSRATLFTTNTTLLYPPRPLRGYKDVGSGWAAKGTARRGSLPSAKYWYITLNAGVPGTPALTDEAVAFIRGDAAIAAPGVSTKGAFTHLRFRVAGVDYKVAGFRSIRAKAAFGPDPNEPLFDEDELYEHQSKGGPLTFWVAASSTAFGGTGSATWNLDVSQPTTAPGFGLHAMTAPASVATPLHIWNWSTGNPFGTLHPMQVLKNILDGSYTSTSETLPYYSTESFTGTADLRRLPSVGVAFRVTQTATLKEWVEEHLLAPHGIVAFGDHRGKVAFKSVHAPDPALGYSTAGLYEFTSTNLRAPHPDWRTTRREQVTRIRMDYEVVARSPGIPNAVGGGPQHKGPFGKYAWTKGGDGIAAALASTYMDHDRIARYGVFEHSYLFDGYGVVGKYDSYAGFPDWVAAFPYWQQDVKGRVFSRFGDGPIQGTLHALPGASTVRPGDYAKLTLASYPNPAGGAGTGGRGGTRLVQILSRDITPEGYRFEYLDAGSAAAPLTTPTLTLSTSTSYPEHALRVAVSGIPTGGAVALYAAESATTSAPGSTDARWHPVFTTAATINTTATRTVPRLKSGTRYFLKGQAFAPDRARSAYSTPQTKVTASLTSPSGLSMSSVKAQTAGMLWTNGETDYPVDVHVDSVTTGTPTTANLLFRLPPGSNRTFLTGLTQGTAYKSWVRHADPYGGYSGFDSTTFTMTSTATTSNVRTAPALGGIYVVFGST